MMTSRMKTMFIAGALLATGAGFSAAQAQTVYASDGYYTAGNYGYYDGGYYNAGFNPLFAPVAAAGALVGAAADIATAPFRGWGYYDNADYDGGYYGAGYGGGWGYQDAGYAYPSYGYGYNYGPEWVATYKGRHIKRDRMAVRSSNRVIVHQAAARPSMKMRVHHASMSSRPAGNVQRMRQARVMDAR